MPEQKYKTVEEFLENVGQFSYYVANLKEYRNLSLSDFGFEESEFNDTDISMMYRREGTNKWSEHILWETKEYGRDSSDTGNDYTSKEIYEIYCEVEPKGWIHSIQEYYGESDEE